MNYKFSKTKVCVVFYCRSHPILGWITRLLSWSRFDHVGLLLERTDKSIVLFTRRGRSGTRFFDSKTLHKHMVPDTIIEMGEVDVSITQVCDFIDYSNKNGLFGLLFWMFIGRFILKGNLPASCGLYVCQVLRICGFRVPNLITPKELYKELTNAANNDCWQSWSWEDYAGQDDS
jgi:hypothetical protein